MSFHGISSPSMRPAGCLIATAPMARPCAVAPGPDPNEILEGVWSRLRPLDKTPGRNGGGGRGSGDLAAVLHHHPLVAVRRYALAIAPPLERPLSSSYSALQGVRVTLS